ncbi:hypothetical protein CAI21_06530 [Alkalilimnicola ehrlichii]|uniref:HTH cro/C1-type domain-containing protein n=1 Tax=Alkalilimnicola ehrlichii TaxID=351052 RepID=A0A3E0X0Z9_9GAMM|nr:hypothetical protein CAI21_06530 [Alkalilimnicola ehrlichii]RFA37847.1 hypothetical protein CAL65_07880 [Alkalilimnicola ehrlichii]
MSSIHDNRFSKLVAELRLARTNKGVTQVELAERLGIQQSDVSKVEKCQRRLDIIELVDWLTALDEDPCLFLQRAGLLAPGAQ